MAAKALSSSLVTLLIFAIILSPISTCDAVRFTQRGIYINNSSPMFVYIYIYMCVCVLLLLIGTRFEVWFSFLFCLQLRDQYVLLVFVAHLHHLALVVSVAQLLLKLSLRMALHDTIYIFQDSMRAKFQE